ncbi:hypothetical protein L1987_47367 [Smallanthus sonchifolius]|uniref:Uncharacterized protein n=1 Tax=Smallanthus sonchifolius TaxID=185202 RepID=A0ACB9G448_9ASTR|nr:hypothetical protein L1987_47367 [Smallanthus sonchifolius]
MADKTNEANKKDESLESKPRAACVDSEISPWQFTRASPSAQTENAQDSGGPKRDDATHVQHAESNEMGASFGNMGTGNAHDMDHDEVLWISPIRDVTEQEDKGIPTVLSVVVPPSSQQPPSITSKSLIKPTRTRTVVLRRREEAKHRFLKEDLAKLLANGLDVNAYGRVMLLNFNLTYSLNLELKFCVLDLSLCVSAFV